MNNPTAMICCPVQAGPAADTLNDQSRRGFGPWVELTIGYKNFRLGAKKYPEELFSDLIESEIVILLGQEHPSAWKKSGIMACPKLWSEIIRPVRKYGPKLWLEIDLKLGLRRFSICADPEELLDLTSF